MKILKLFCQRNSIVYIYRMKQIPKPMLKSTRLLFHGRIASLDLETIMLPILIVEMILDCENYD